MAIDALVHSRDGESRTPLSRADWDEWVSASRIRHYLLGDPVLDWFERYGAQHGYVRDDEQPGYDPQTDFTAFIFEQGRQFEEAVLRLLAARYPIQRIATEVEDNRSLDQATETFEAMAAGAPIIHQGVLRDAEHRTYGAPDLLVRSDVLRELFPDALTEIEASVPAPDLDGRWHYRVVDVKFTTLHLLVGGELGNGGSAPAYKGQLFIYNRALGRLQGYEPPVSYLLGRGWEQRDERSSNCLERLAPVRQAGMAANKQPLAGLVAEACEWVRTLRREGADWVLLPQPSRRELWPDAGNLQDGPWHSAKKQVIEQLDDLTMLWQVGAARRDEAHAKGVFRWTDPACTPELLGFKDGTRTRVLGALLDVNQSSDGPPVRPVRIEAARDQWHETPPLEFYVDFETFSDLADDFSKMPLRGGQPLIFMIGCGHIEAGEWRFASFTAPAVDEEAEAEIIEAWCAHMAAVRVRLAPGGEDPRVIHWSSAEVSTFETAYNSAKARHEDTEWPASRWFDFLARVMRAEPVVVRGAMAFGLKSVTRALHKQGLISTLWEDGLADGLGAMVGAWSAYEKAGRTDVAVRSLPLMQAIEQYNEVDCKAMWDAVRYLREHH